MSLISQITALAQAIGDDIQTLLAHTSNTSNPHSVDKTDVGLGNVDNTSDLSKPISTATQTALDDKQNVLLEGAFVDGDKTKLDGIESGATGDMTGAEIKALYEAEADTNAFQDSHKIKLAGIQDAAEVNVQSDWNAVSGDALILNKPTIPTVSDTVYGAGWDGNTDAPSKNAVYDKIETLADASHTHTASEITDFDTEVSNNTSVVANTAKLTANTANVDAAGATMNTDTNVSANSWVLDEDDMVSNSNTKVPTQQSVKAYVDNNAGGGLDGFQGVKTASFTPSTSWADITGYNSAETEEDTLFSGQFNETTGVLTLPDIGVYMVHYRANWDPNTAVGTNTVLLRLELDGTALSYSVAQNSNYRSPTGLQLSTVGFHRVTTDSVNEGLVLQAIRGSSSLDITQVSFTAYKIS